MPNIVKDPEQLASANSLGLVAAFGTFPLGAVMFAALAAVAHWLGGFHALDALGVKQESLAIWVDGGTFLVSAFLISRLRLDEGARGTRTRVSGRADVARHQGGLGLHSLEPARARCDDRPGGRPDRRRRDRSARRDRRARRAARRHGAFGLLHDCARRRRRDRGRRRCCGCSAGLPRPVRCSPPRSSRPVSRSSPSASMSSLLPAFLLVAVLGAAPGCAYVTGFTMLQESVADDMRGRTFATLYTIVRLCLLLSLTIWPFIAGGLNARVAAHAQRADPPRELASRASRGAARVVARWRHHRAVRPRRASAA